MTDSRLIPARAGNTLVQMRARPHAPAHPRSRGEHTFTLDGAGGNRGSSPLARGTQSGTVRAAAGRRLIPARAGNTCSRGPTPRLCRAHPRSRGEHGSLRSAFSAFSGSSPLARGTLVKEVRDDGTFGLIPARSGNTRSVRSGRRTQGAHPRSHGEHGDSQQVTPLKAGSSPLARGTLLLNRLGISVQGLIPARAGNTIKVTGSGMDERAHPRSRGEHGGSECVELLIEGSSPLARGTR